MCCAALCTHSLFNGTCASPCSRGVVGGGCRVQGGIRAAGAPAGDAPAAAEGSGPTEQRGGGSCGEAAEALRRGECRKGSAPFTGGTAVHLRALQYTACTLGLCCNSVHLKLFARLHGCNGQDAIMLDQAGCFASLLMPSLQYGSTAECTVHGRADLPHLLPQAVPGVQEAVRGGPAVGASLMAEQEALGDEPLPPPAGDPPCCIPPQTRIAWKPCLALQ